MSKIYKDVWIDQYGNTFYANTLKELKEQIPGRISKMHQDHKDKTYNVGYVIGQHWLNRYTAVTKAA